MNPMDICAAHQSDDQNPVRPSRPPIQTTVAYVCDDPDQADGILAGEQPGFCYQRDGHPNEKSLSAFCERLHSVGESITAAVTSSGMAAMSLAVVALLKSGDHVLLSNRLYGKTVSLIVGQGQKFGIEASEVDVFDTDALTGAFRANTKLLIVETISNPQIRVADIEQLAKLAHSHNSLLLVDNTFATPIVCQPFHWGADLVLESITKFMNGHGDVMLGMLAGKKGLLNGIDKISSTWGFAASPFDCWIAERGMMTLAMRMKQASKNAQAVADYLAGQEMCTHVNFPGLDAHPDQEVSKKQFNRLDGEPCFANMVSFELSGGAPAAARFIRRSPIPFCASLGEMSTTLSHPASTSHRLLNSEQLGQLDISEGTIRLSIGCESSELLVNHLHQTLVGLDS